MTITLRIVSFLLHSIGFHFVINFKVLRNILILQRESCFLHFKKELSLTVDLSSQLRCLNGILPHFAEEDVEKYCFTDISQPFFDGFPPWSRRNQCYIIGLLCGYVLHITKGRTIKIPPVVNLILWQFFLAIFFAVIYGPYNTELEAGINTPLQRSIIHFFCLIRNAFKLTSRFWYSCSNLMWGICLFWLIFACCRGYGGAFKKTKFSNPSTFRSNK